ncbi:hypothetical protein Pcar_1820 [Syntrophotalea carbinolica DSM 2380]|uniref:Uncharacterized protein n=1 Tax=Syntrophotalea carbinolica (strain DSM 2380 / NBRC 103641 / GraBd1) TaxID=338963 RepID=Q3A3J6_SYNC1|nr:hypothetical protein [Syntrophotalea carbinolica]ABA89061.1 hypothetical protein Pcar_1820 [Syntrophotalea carbinolica DSM 2380]
MAKKNTDFLGNIQKALAGRDTAREALDAINGSHRTLEEKLKIADTRFKGLAESGRDHLDYWGKAQGERDVPWTSLFGENNCHAEAVFASLHPELSETMHQAIEAQHQRHVEVGGLAISAADLPGEVAKAEARLFTAEQALEAAYCAAEEAGFLVNRDPDMSPESVLGIERNELLPHDFFSEKMERIIAARDGSHAAFVDARERWQGSRGKEAFLKTEAEIEAAKKHTERLLAAKNARSEEVQRKTRLASALEDYVRDHRKAPPVAQPPAEDSRKPVTMQLKDNGPAKGTIWRDRFEQATGIGKADK